MTGTNLGCVVVVAFGKNYTSLTSNSQALLACGTTNQVVAIAPPGIAGTTVNLRIATGGELLRQERSGERLARLQLSAEHSERT